MVGCSRYRTGAPRSVRPSLHPPHLPGTMEAFGVRVFVPHGTSRPMHSTPHRSARAREWRRHGGLMGAPPPSPIGWRLTTVATSPRRRDAFADASSSSPGHTPSAEEDDYDARRRLPPAAVAVAAPGMRGSLTARV
jgi:hypothetical protein